MPQFENKNKRIGGKVISKTHPYYKKLFSKNKDTIGLTHITINKDGNEVWHWYLKKIYSNWAEADVPFVSCPR